MTIAILVCKLLSRLLTLFGRGSSLPGKIALKLCPDILSRLTMPETVVAVTGSNGKTSTSELIRALAESTGRRVVANGEGSNQTEGIVTALLRASDLKGRVAADIAVLESDERFCQYTFKGFSPTALVVTNLFRDQLTRNGHSEFVNGELKKGIPLDTTLIINADEPVSASLAEGQRHLLAFGVEPSAFTEPEGAHHAYDDGGYCPLCGGKMDYAWRIHNHLGGFCCRACGYKRRKPDHSVTALTSLGFELDGLYDVVPEIPSPIFAYNIAAAFTVGVEIFGLEPGEAAGVLSGYRLSNDRIQNFNISGHPCTFMLSKHENSICYDQNLRAMLDSDSEAVTEVIIFDQLSRKYIANDISWLWDIDFELLNAPKVKQVILSGSFANDLACRLSLGGVNMKKVLVCPSLDDMMKLLRTGAVGDIYVQTCFTDIGKFTSRVVAKR